MAWSYFFSITKLWPIWNRSSGTRAIERILGDEVGPGGARVGKRSIALCGRRRSWSWVSRIARWASALWGPLGKLREVSFPGCDRLGKLLLALEDRADLERRVHGELGPIAAGLG